MSQSLFVSRELPGDALEALPDHVAADVWEGRGAPPREALIARAQRADGLLCMLTDRIDPELLDACPGLKVVSSMSVGLDHVDVDACTQRGLPVGNTPGVLTETTAELTLALMLAVSRRLVESDRFLRAGAWKRWEPDLLLGTDLAGATLGIIGMGAIGRAVAERARAFGMQVVAWSRTRRELPGIRWLSLEELLETSDVVSVHVALNEATRNLLDAGRIGLLPRHAILINTARGGIVDESALCERLRGGNLAGAGLDVFETEPLPADSPLRELENAVLVPHIGSATRRTRARMAGLAVANAVAGLEGRELPHCANPETQTG